MATEGLTVGETAMGGDPFDVFALWLKAAEASEPNDPQRPVAGHRGRERHAGRADGAAQGF